MRPSITRLEASVLALVSMGIDPYPTRRGNHRLVRTAINRLHYRELIDFDSSTERKPLETRAGRTALRVAFEWAMKKGVTTW